MMLPREEGMGGAVIQALCHGNQGYRDGGKGITITGGGPCHGNQGYRNEGRLAMVTRGYRTGK